MKNFFSLILGIFLGGIIVAFLMPLAFDYSSRIDIARLLGELKPLQQQIEKGLYENNLQEQGIESTNEYRDLLKNTHIDYLEVSKNGRILVKASPHGEILIMIPKHLGNSIVWKCLGGSNKDVPVACRK